MRWKGVLYCVAIGFLALLLTSGSGFAADNNYHSNNVGVGYQGMMLGSSSWMNGVSARGWLGDNFGLEGSLSYAGIDVDYNNNSVMDADFTNFEGKAMYAPIVKSNSRFYLGGKLGYGTLSIDTAAGDEEINPYSLGVFIGSEWNFTEIPELGFNFDVGYNYTEIDEDDVEIGLDGIGVTMGIHYYF